MIMVPIENQNPSIMRLGMAIMMVMVIYDRTIVMVLMLMISHWKMF